MQTQLLQFCKDTVKVSSLPLLKITTKSTHYSPPLRRRKCQYCGLKIYKRSQNLISKHQLVKNLQIAKTFLKNVNKEAT